MRAGEQAVYAGRARLEPSAPLWTGRGAVRRLPGEAWPRPGGKARRAPGEKRCPPARARRRAAAAAPDPPVRCRA